LVEVLVHFLGFVLLGTLIGGAVRMLVAGRAGGWWVSMVGGGCGGLLGGILGRRGGFLEDLESAGFILSILGAFAVVAVYHIVASRRLQT
jgi:uncharacterized membrane protein YeaQ/YmgE (transglycosylase-associated protein family)